MKSVTAKQMAFIDSIVIDTFKIPRLCLMENAGRLLAENIQESFFLNKKKVVIIAGEGFNGADGCVCARYLANAGVQVSVYLVGTSFKDETKLQMEILEHLDISLHNLTQQKTMNELKKVCRDNVIIVDALFGIGLSRPVQGVCKDVITFVNSLRLPVVACDIPSGFNADTGEQMPISIQADMTVTFGLPKKAFLQKKTHHVIGKLVVVDIGIPLQKVFSYLRKEKG